MRVEITERVKEREIGRKKQFEIRQREKDRKRKREVYEERFSPISPPDALNGVTTGTTVHHDAVSMFLIGLLLLQLGT
nr:hypothetical protein BgiMline_006308 [Biomphalaria glabrata]